MRNALIVIAGASRSGKSTLAGQLGRLLNCEVFELDEIHDAIKPVLGRWKTAPAAVVEQAMQASTLAIIDAAASGDKSVIVEGGWIQPFHAAKLAIKYPGCRVVVVYLGYPSLDLDFAVEHMKLHKSRMDWIRPKPREVRTWFFREQIEGSRWYRDQCEMLGLTFIDTSFERDATIRRTAEELSRMVKNAE